MVTGFWGKKIGMTQLFLQNDVVPVTAVDVSGWVVADIKTKERDGYSAVQFGCLKNAFKDKKFDISWLKKSKKYFSFLKEVRLSKDISEMDQPIAIGKPANFRSILSEGDIVDVFGMTKGCGFAGVVKRHGFAGAPGSHGATMGKAPGSLGNFCSQGRVVKGKKLPGHMGNRRRMMGNLKVVKIQEDSDVVLVKGSIPGKSGSLVFLQKEKVT